MVLTVKNAQQGPKKLKLQLLPKPRKRKNKIGPRVNCSGTIFFMKTKIKIFILFVFFLGMHKTFSCASAGMIKCYPIAITQQGNFIFLRAALQRSGEGCSHSIYTEIMEWSSNLDTIISQKNDTFLSDSCKHTNFINNELKTSENKPLLTTAIEAALIYSKNNFSIKEWFNLNQIWMYDRVHLKNIKLLKEISSTPVDSTTAFEKDGNYNNLFEETIEITGLKFEEDSLIFDSLAQLFFIQEEEFGNLGVISLEYLPAPVSISTFSTPSGIRIMQVHRNFNSDFSNPSKYEISELVECPIIALNGDKQTLKFNHQKMDWHHSGFDFIYIIK